MIKSQNKIAKNCQLLVHICDLIVKLFVRSTLGKLWFFYLYEKNQATQFLVLLNLIQKKGTKNAK